MPDGMAPRLASTSQTPSATRRRPRHHPRGPNQPGHLVRVPHVVVGRDPPTPHTMNAVILKRKDFFEQCLIGRNEQAWQPSWLLAS